MVTITCYSDIPGWGDFHRCHTRLVSQLPANATILEVGAGFGRGTWTLLDVMSEAMRLTVVDSFKLSSQHLWQQFCKNGSALTLDRSSTTQFDEMTADFSQKELFLQSVSQHRNYSQIEKVYAITSDFYMGFNRQPVFDLVFLDGSHEFDVVRRELEYFKHSTLLTGHDYINEDCVDVKRAVDDFMLHNPNKTFVYYPIDDVYVIHNTNFKFCKTSEPLSDSR